MTVARDSFIIYVIESPRHARNAPHFNALDMAGNVKQKLAPDPVPLAAAQRRPPRAALLSTS
jgi:hypothetical protein